MAHRPRMSPERVERLRAWHEDAYVRDRRSGPVVVEALGRSFVVPPEVYPPNPFGLAELVETEVRDGERVLDLGTGSGVNGIVAAARAGEVVAVDVNPAAVACARENAARNGVAERFAARESDLFAAVDGRFDLIVFDPPFRWFRPRDLRERGTADEGYATLTAFFEQARGRLTGAGRILLAFGTTGDIDYLHELIRLHGFSVETLRERELERDGETVRYLAYRLA